MSVIALSPLSCHKKTQHVVPSNITPCAPSFKFETRPPPFPTMFVTVCFISLSLILSVVAAILAVSGDRVDDTANDDNNDDDGYDDGPLPNDFFDFKLVSLADDDLNDLEEL